MVQGESRVSDYFGALTSRLHECTLVNATFLIYVGNNLRKDCMVLFQGPAPECLNYLIHSSGWQQT
jgi:hypothetical protein